MSFADRSLFYNSLLLFSEEDMEKLTKSTIAIAGIGGVGAIITELLARNGVGNLKIADPDPYEHRNLNRQIIATYDTIGINKATAAKERIKKINPDCNVQIFTEGINLENIRKFCTGADVILAQTDTESTKIILHRIAKDMRIPVVCGSRSSLYEHRWKVKARVWNYKKNNNLPCYDTTNHPEIASIPFEKLTDEFLKDFDQSIKNKKQLLFKEYAKNNPEIFGSISQKDLLERIENNDYYFNRHVCSVIANTGGCLAATAALKLILNGTDNDLEICLW